MFYIWYYTINNPMENDNTIFQNPNSSSGIASNNFSAFQQQSHAMPLQNQNMQATSVKPQMVQLNNNIGPVGKSGSGGFKKILNIFLSILVILGLVMIIFVFLLPSINNSSTSSNKVELTYWGLFEDSNVMQGIVSDFEKENPDIKINYIKQDVSQYRERLTTRIANGTGPDIFRFHNTWYPMLKNYLLPLPSSTISSDQFTSVYYPVAQRDLVKNGAIYGIPLEIDTLALYINTQLFQSAGLTPPTNWNDFINDARSLTVKDSTGKITTAGAAMGTYDNITHAPDIVSLLLLQNSVDVNNFSQYPDRIKDALTFYLSFANDSNAVWDNTLDPSQLAFAKGNLGMFFGYSSDYFAIKQFNPNLTFQIVPVPQLPSQNVSMASYWAEGVSLKSKHQKEDLLFLKFLAKKETQQKLFADESKIRDFGEPYSRVDLADSLKTNPMVYPFVLQAPSAYSSPFVDGTYDNDLNQKLNSYLQETINTRSNSSDTFVNNVTSLLQQY